MLAIDKKLTSRPGCPGLRLERPYDPVIAPFIDFVLSAFRDLIPIIAALEYNQWFTKLSSKDLKLVSSLMLLGWVQFQKSDHSKTYWGVAYLLLKELLEVDPFCSTFYKVWNMRLLKEVLPHVLAASGNFMW